MSEIEWDGHPALWLIRFCLRDVDASAFPAKPCVNPAFADSEKRSRLCYVAATYQESSFDGGLSPEATVYKCKGCDLCNGKGVKGRIGIYEVLKMNSEIRAMVAKGARTEEIHAAAVKNGMLDLKAYACILLEQGLTSVEEVMSVVSVQE